MSDGLVRLTIDGVRVAVPQGTMIVDAAKEAGIDIPVFCYHPKLKPAGMCRMCLVEVGRPNLDRATGKAVLDQDGRIVIAFGAKLETACTTPVGEGFDVRVMSEKAIVGRKQILEFLLTSHPLDCPVCDKGGECPLQDQTMVHGPGQSRFLFDEKMRLDKRIPLGELIFLDRERCIQCARCIRFQDEVVDDPVIGFSERGRHMEIVSFSDPGFDSYFSGNTTDICPVGALTTVDFRFGARPWELNAAASICPHCPVGCNLILNTRREAKAGGREVIKRVMPRQNEDVNEIWICDKGRFGHHFTGAPERLTRPLVRKEGRLVEATWEEALGRAAEGLRAAGARTVGLAGGRASNEDLLNFRSLVESLGGKAHLYQAVGGGQAVREFGLNGEADIGRLGKGDAILVIASDLHEEAPIWWLRVKQAAERGTALIVANARATRLDKHAAHLIRYTYPKAGEAALKLLRAVEEGPAKRSDDGQSSYGVAAEVLKHAKDLIIFFGHEGLGYQGSEALSHVCANLLQVASHAGKTNSGIVAVWPHANTQGAWEIGLRPVADGLLSALSEASALCLMACDPFGDDPALERSLSKGRFVVVQELFLTRSASLADVVLPAQSHVEREGTYTSGDRRVQRFYPAVPPRGESEPDWRIAALLGERLGIELEGTSAAAVMRALGEAIPAFTAAAYQALAKVTSQGSPTGGRDAYYGGTAYKNEQGLGVRLARRVGFGKPFEIPEPSLAGQESAQGCWLIPIYRLYDRGTTLNPSRVLDQRRQVAHVEVNPEDASSLGAKEGDRLEVRWEGRSEILPLVVSANAPRGALLVPRSTGVPAMYPAKADVKVLERATG